MASASSGAAPPQTGEDGIYMPKDLVDAVAACKRELPACEWWQKHGACRKGNKCKFQHAGDPGQALTLPRVSFSCKDRKISMSIRPPFDQGWQQFFKTLPRRVLPGGQRHADKLLYQLAFMAEGDKVLQVQTRSQGWVKSGGRTWGVCPKDFPDYLGHICSYPQAMSILKAGALSAGESSRCGTGGVVGRRISIESSQGILEAATQTWDLAAAASDFGGQGCMFVLACNGCLINGSYNLEMPPGSIAVRDGQYAAHPTTFDFVAVMFDFEGLVQALFPHMLEADTEYTRELHSSLVACQQWLRNPRQAGDDRATVKLLNAITMEGGRDTQEKQKALRLSEKEAQQAQRQQQWQQRQESWQRQGAAEERRRQQGHWQAQLRGVYQSLGLLSFKQQTTNPKP